VSKPVIRPYRPGDEAAIQGVIKSVFDEYGFTWEPDGYNRDAYEVEEHYHHGGGGFWVLELDESIVGTVGLKKRSEKRCELYRLYLPQEYRGSGLGRLLYEFVREEARRMGFSEMEIWSDKKLETAHQMYLRSGAISLGDRICDDPDQSPEWGFLLSL
jgi:putative acetyltransferase